MIRGAPRPLSKEDGINEPQPRRVMDGIHAGKRLDGGISRLVVDPESGLTITGDVGNGIITRANGIRTH